MAPPLVSRFAGRRGLTLLELMLALSITALVGAAIAAMLGAVSSGVGSRRDTRAIMLLASAAQSRLAAYVVPSRCVLDVDGANFVLWLEDSRESDTVHATEIRWFVFDQNAGTLTVHYVDFPDGWTQVARDMEDNEYPAKTNWNTVLAHYQSHGWISSRTLIDSLDSLTISTDHASDQSARHLTFDLVFRTDSQITPVTAAATLRQHQAPIK